MAGKSDRDEARDWQLFHERRDERARERLILRYVHLVFSTKIKIIPRMTSWEDGEDILSAGHVALITAVDTFDPLRCSRFKTHAICKIRWAMMQFLRQTNPVPRTVYDRRKLLDAAEVALLERYDANKITDHLRATELNLTLDGYYTLKAYCDYPEVVGEERWDADEEEWHNQASQIVDPAPSLEAQITERQLLDIVKTCVTWLPTRERHTIEWYYWRDAKMIETAGYLGCSQSRAVQLHQAALEHLRGMLSPLQAVL